MIFIDTSAVYALADAGDPNHDAAVARFHQALGDGEPILTHNYVLIESAALLAERNRRELSLVDCASFGVMRRHGLDRALAFDEGFEREGFRIYAG